ncbi:MAG: phenylalanyl-tRNA synthetase alpha chain [Thermoplasmata archaeon]|jgi:phenylalanyl-tRNA synthetase alpha chain|nr:phenylalanyl-tRNA synthetase alpha chain [Thermoplasmata archaeon]
MQELSNLEKRVLLALGSLGESATPEQIRDAGAFGELVQVMNGSSWLQAKGLVRHEETLRTFIALGSEGRAALERGLPERRAVDALKRAGGTLAIAALERELGSEVSVATGWLRRKQLAAIEKRPEGNALVLTAKGEHEVHGPDEEVLQQLAGGERPEPEIDAEGLKLLLQRQNVVRRREEITRIIHLTTKGKLALQKGVEVKPEVNEITSDLIGSGKWRDVDIRPYDVTAFAPTATGGRKHPLRQIIDRIRLAFLEMGFSEIEGPTVRSAFWNMDALFTPQDHPARAMQDTFYLNNPSRFALKDDEVALVKAIHEHGGETGSRGWRNAWSREVGEQALLRTHTTVDTIQWLARHPDPPVKVFSVDRVFRNEAIDATHLPEFHQVEGIVMEEGANLRQLIGLLKQFYAKMGFEDVQVRASYYPYTEPSLDVAVWYNNRWLELGGAGIFRPEVTEPWGIKHPVLAWGLGLERLGMLMLGLKDLRELYVSDVEWLRNQPLIE